MAENRSHAPGHEPTSGGINMHKVIAGGADDSFGVGAIPGSAKIAGKPPSGAMVPDSDRCCGIKMGGGKMDATRHSDHGPHR